MSTFAETAIVNYRLSFAEQVKQMSIFCFRLLQTNGSLPFPFAENKQKLSFSLVPFSVCGIPETWRHGDMGMETSN
jgi:hypothetical protein